MRSIYLAVFALTFVVPARVAAQSGTTQAAVSEPTPDSAQAAPKKKGGMFGKVKGLAKSKIVKTVAKVALCTAVPGGQVIAGALDAAETKSVAGAANTALSGGSSSCMPGMGMAGKGMAGAAAAGMAGNGLAGAAGMGVASLAGGGVPGMPGGMPSGAMSGGGMSPEQMSQMMEQYKKMGVPPAQIAAMQQMMAAQMAQAAPGAAAGSPGAVATPPASAAAPSEGAGKPIEFSPQLLLDLKKGKTAIRNIDWVAGTASLTAAGNEPFNQAMSQIAAALTQAGGKYRLDLYFDKRYDDVGVKTLGPQRFTLIQTALGKGGLGTTPGGVPKAGNTKKDKDPRLEIVKVK
jgi:hypothetical protein